MADSGFRVSLSWVLVGLCILGSFFGPKAFAAGEEEEGNHKFSGNDIAEDYNEVRPQGAHDIDDGSISSAGDGEGERFEPCGTDLSTFLALPYGNTSNMICTPIWSSFVLRYLQSEDNVLTIILSAVYTTGWVGIGFSNNGLMVGSSCMVGWFNTKGQPRIKQYYLEGFHASQVTPDKGELQLVEHVPPVVALHGAMIYLAFQVKFPAPLSHQPIILAFASRYPNLYHLTKHDDQTAIWVDFSQASVMNIDSTYKRHHGMLGIIGWGLILPMGAIVARYLKHKDPLWYYLHAGIQFVGFITGLVAVLLGVQLYHRINADIPAHKGIGIFVLVLSILQILAFFLRPNKESKIRKYWNWYHHWFGRMTLFFGSLNVVLGIHFGEAGNEWKIGYGFLIGIILVAVIVLEALSCMRRSEKPILPPSSFQMNPI